MTPKFVSKLQQGIPKHMQFECVILGLRSPNLNWFWCLVTSRMFAGPKFQWDKLDTLYHNLTYLKFKLTQTQMYELVTPNIDIIIIHTPNLRCPRCKWSEFGPPERCMRNTLMEPLIFGGLYPITPNLAGTRSPCQLCGQGRCSLASASMQYMGVDEPATWLDCAKGVWQRRPQRVVSENQVATN